MSDGLSGLGALNVDNINSTIDFEKMNTGNNYNSHNNGNKTDKRMLETNPSKFKSLEEYSQYLIGWFGITTVVAISATDDMIKQSLQFQHMFNIRFINNEDEQVYTIVPAYNIDLATQFINSLNNYGPVQNKIVIFAYPFPCLANPPVGISDDVLVDIVFVSESFDSSPLYVYITFVILL